MITPAQSPNPWRDAAYYQTCHEQIEAYQTNNWLLDELDRIGAFDARSVLELACGNGRFLRAAAGRFDRVYGCDWAISPMLGDVLAAHPNVTFFRTNLYDDLPPCAAELVVSADFLEHIAPGRLVELVQRIDGLSTRALHKVACYDDGHSHLSVFDPAAWHSLFLAVNTTYRLERVDNRAGDGSRPIAVFVKDGIPS